MSLLADHRGLSLLHLGSRFRAHGVRGQLKVLLTILTGRYAVCRRLHRCCGVLHLHGRCRRFQLAVRGRGCGSRCCTTAG